ncbi:MAG: sigma-70 family RNA polymerase sigma factor [Salinisphaera sp.]|nr:sigma-70 family RNA polymerase sigma factor [Salinisphaera sp.]MDN5939712.1 sigma-70 family RNA polymerase sigma factor [Salinisphaera sp.]
MTSKQHRFETMVAALTDDLFRYAFWLCRDRHLAEDLVQETLLRAWRFMDRLRDQAAVKGWLLTTLRREHARLYERKRLQQVDLDVTTVLDEHSRGPGSDAQVSELRQRLFALPADYREPLAMQVLLGCKVAEIAAVMELTESAVMTRLFRARKQLQESMGVNVEVSG